uniref:LEM domain containing 1 n=2 Tax=Equus TaxID=9789 RepID=A0A9L0TDM2_HORSE
MVDVKCLSDCELRAELDKLGFSPGPILPSTRKAYEKKLVQLLVSTPCVSPVMNGPRELDRAWDRDGSEGVPQEHRTPQPVNGISPRRRPAAQGPGVPGAGTWKVFRWA